MSRGIAQAGEASYDGPVTPRATSIPVIVVNHIALDGVARYVDTAAAQLAVGDVPPTG